MKVRLATLVLLGFLFSLATAQTGADSTRIFKPNSFQFRVYNFISLSSFKGTMLSYKYHRSDKTAYRVGIGVGAEKWKEENSRDDNYYADTTTFMFDADLDMESIRIDLVVEYLRYFNVHDDIKIFAGSGPLVSFDILHQNSKDFSSSGAAYQYVYKNHKDQYAFGLSFSYGLEWFFRKNMSLHAEYGFDLAYFLDKYTRTEYTIDTDDTVRRVDNSEKRYGIAFDDRGVLFGLSVYF